MNKPFYTLTVGGEDYHLCFSCAAVAQLEEKLGAGLLAVMSDQSEVSKVSTQAALLHAALQKYQHGIKLADTYELYDAIMTESGGNGITAVINVIMEAMKVSGFMPPSEETESNIKVFDKKAKTTD